MHNELVVLVCISFSLLNYMDSIGIFLWLIIFERVGNYAIKVKAFPNSMFVNKLGRVCGHAIWVSLNLFIIIQIWWRPKNSMIIIHFTSSIISFVFLTSILYYKDPPLEPREVQLRLCPTSPFKFSIVRLFKSPRPSYHHQGTNINFTITAMMAWLRGWVGHGR